MTASPQTFAAVLHQLWGENGAPREAWKATGALYKKLEKGMDATAHAFIDDPENSSAMVAYVPLEEDIGTNGGASESQAFTDASNLSIMRFRVPLAQHWCFAKLKNSAHRMVKAGANQYGMDARMIVATRTTAQCKQELSWKFWCDGTGRASKGDGAYSVAGTAITLKNRRSAKRFKVNSKIVLIAYDQAKIPGGMATPRTGTLTVTAVNEITGVLTTSAAVNTISGADNRDYLGFNSDFADAELPTVNGVFTTLPITATEANTTLYGINRGLNPTVRAGRRVTVDGSMDMWDIGARLIAEATEGMTNTINKRTIYFPTSELESIIQDAAAHYQISQVSTTSDPTKMTFGVIEAQLVAPGLGIIGLQCDPWLCDIEVTAEEDRSIVMLCDDDWKVQTGPGGENWYTPMMSQWREAGPGSTEQGAQYGMCGQLLNLNTSQQIVASTRAAD